MGRHRVSQITLAGHIGISQPALSRRLLGEHPFDMDELLSIAAFFNVEVTALLSGISEQGASSSPWITTQLSMFDTIEDAIDAGFLTAAA